jgi:hypothetical protein
MRGQHARVGQAKRRHPSRQNVFKGVDRLFEAAGLNGFVRPQGTRTHDFVQSHAFVAELARPEPNRYVSDLKSKAYHGRPSRMQLRNCGLVPPHDYGCRNREGSRQAEEFYIWDSGQNNETAHHNAHAWRR